MGNDDRPDSTAKRPVRLREWSKRDPSKGTQGATVARPDSLGIQGFKSLTVSVD